MSRRIRQLGSHLFGSSPEGATPRVFVGELKSDRLEDVNLSALINTSPVGIIAVDAKGLITLFNHRAEEILNYRAEDVLGKPVSGLYRDALEPRRIGKLLHQADDHVLIGYETYVKQQDGGILPVRHTAAFMYDESGKRIGSVGYFELRHDANATNLLQLETAKHAALIARMTTIGDLNATLEMIPHVTQQVVGCDAVVLYSYDSSKKKFNYPPTHSGVNYEDRAWPNDQMPPTSVVFKIIERDQPYLAESVQQDPLLGGRRFQQEEGIRSCVALPLKAREERVGVMFVNYRTEHVLAEPELESISFFADQAALAISNAHLYAQARRRGDALAGINEAIKVISSTPDLQAALNKVAEQGLRVVGCAEDEGCFSHVALLEGDSLRFIAASSPDIIAFLENAVSPINISNPHERLWIAGRCARTGSTQVIQDVLRDNDYYEIRPGIQSQLSVPLTVLDDKQHKRVIGVLSIEDPKLNAFADEDVTNVELLAAQAGLAIMNSQLRDASENVARMTVLGEFDKTLMAVPRWTRRVTGCDAVLLHVFDQTSNQLIHPPLMEGVNYENKILGNTRVKSNSIVLNMLDSEKLSIVEDITDDARFRNTRFARDEGIKSLVVMPLRVAERKVGVIFVNYRSRHRFSEGELKSIRLLSDQAAVAISNAQALDRAKRRADALEALNEASQVITRSLDLNETLRAIPLQALRIVGTEPEDKGAFSRLALIEDNELRFIEASSAGVIQEIDSNPGIAGRAARTGDTQRVPDVHADPDYDPIRSYVKSQLSVPLRVIADNNTEKVIGVLSIEHPNQNAFSVEDQRNIELLARAAALAINNAKRYEEITRVRGLAWMGLTSTTWRHSLANTVYSIRRYVAVLRKEFGHIQGISDHVTAIEQLSDQLLAKPVTEPLTLEEGVGPVQINAMIRSYAQQLTKLFGGLSASLELDLTTCDSVSVHISEEWLRQALDILIDNAVKATAGSPVRRIAVRTKQAKDRVEISVCDNGPGIPDEIRTRLFRERIDTGKGRTGMGLLITKLIVQTYGGSVRLESDTPGTTITVSLPLDSARSEDPAD